MKKSEFNEIIKKFDFCKPEDDHAVTATGRFRRDLEKQLKNNRKLIDEFEKDRQILYSKGLWSKSLDTKQVGHVSDKSGKKYKIWQTRTKNCSQGKGRIWFQFRDDQPDAPRPVILLLGCELTRKQSSKNKERIRDLCKKGVVKIFPTPVMAEPNETPDSGKIEDFEDDPDIRPMYHGEYSAMMDMFDSEVGIRPTKEQLDTVLNPAAPIFINGQAGTGKTVLLAIRIGTLFIHKTSQKENWRTLTTCMSAKVIDRLKSNTGDVITKVFRDMKSGQEFQSTLLSEYQDGWKTEPKNERNSIFRPFSLLQYEILDEDIQRTFDNPLEEGRKRRIGFSKFSRSFYSRRDYRKSMSSELAWFGIRSLIKGFAGRNNGEWLQINDLKRHVSERTLDIFDEKDLKNLSACFESYQKWLEDEKFYDDMDLACAAWKSLEKGADIVQFDEIYLDEAQDLTDLEFRILLMLLKPERRKYAILAGDPLQTINPTGFDWPRIKDMMYNTLGSLTEKNVTIDDPMTLTRNYRTPIEMVQMGNILLHKRAYYMRENIPDQSSSKTTEKPTVIEIGRGKKDEVEAIARLLQQPSDKKFIVTYTVDNAGIEDFIETDKAAKIAQTESNAHLESITDVKGLERDTVILYRFADMIEASTPYLVKNHQRESIESSDKIKLAFALNRLYISLTRSKKNLFILDSKRGIETFWNSGLFQDEEQLLEFENPEETTNILMNAPQLNDDIDHIKYSEQCMDRFDETEDPKFLKWAIKALEEVVTGERNQDWFYKFNKSSAFNEEIKADELGEKSNPKQWAKHLIKAAEHWSEYGNKPKQYQLLRKAKQWDLAILVDCPERKSDGHFLKAILGRNLSDTDVKHLIEWVKKENTNDWLSKTQIDSINKKLVFILIEDKNTSQVENIIKSTSESATKNLWTNELIKQYKLKNDYRTLKPILSNLLKTGKSRVLKEGMHWCLLNEFNEPGKYNAVSSKRINAQKKLVEYAEGEKREKHQIDIALDYIELVIKELNGNWKKIESMAVVNIVNNYDIHIEALESEMTENLSQTINSKIDTYLRNYNLRNVEHIINFSSLITSDNAGFDEMRSQIVEAVDSAKFRKECIERLSNSRACKSKDIFDSKEGTLCLINFYDFLDKNEETEIQKEIRQKSNTLKSKMDKRTRGSDRFRALTKLRNYTNDRNMFFDADEMTSEEIEYEIKAMKERKIVNLEESIRAEYGDNINLLSRFKPNLIDGELNGNKGGRKVLRNAIMAQWEKASESSVAEREEFTNSCVALGDFKRLKNVQNITKDPRLKERIKAEEILAKKSRTVKDVKEAIKIFKKLELPLRLKYAKQLMPKDPTAEIGKLMVPEKGMLGLADALEIITKEVKAKRMKKPKALSILNKKRKAMGSAFYDILTSSWSDKVINFVVSMEGIELPSVKKDPLMHDWFSTSLVKYLFKVKDVKLDDMHMNSIKSRMQKLIEERLIKEPNAIVGNELRRNRYDSLLRRMWSLDNLKQKDKLSSFAWFSLFELFENSPPNKNDLTGLMKLANLEYDKKSKVEELRKILFTETVPEHEKMTEAEMMPVINELCR